MKRIKSFIAGLLCFGLMVSVPAMSAQRKMIQIKGSDTLVNLVQILSESYMAKNPRSPVAVLGGGSGTGVAALINGTCDIANLSRPMNEKEIRMAKDKGFAPRTYVIAVDGLSVIVNGSNTVSRMTMDQIGAMFRGEIKNWKEVGGPDGTVSLYGRQSNSGTYGFFQEHVLGNQNYSPHMKQMNGNAQIVEGVTADKLGIGYVGVGYVVDARGNVKKGIKILEVSRDARSSAYSPLDKAAVESGEYPIARGLMQATAGVPTGAVLEFIRFELSPEGQKIVAKEGFFPVGTGQMTENEKNLK